MAKKRRRKPKLTDQQKLQRQQKIEIRKLFKNIGFKRVTGIAGKEFMFADRKSEIDDSFYYENVLLFVEYTITSNPGDHLLKKKIIYDKINDNPTAFVSFLLKEEKFQSFQEFYNNSELKDYTQNQLQIKFLYCSRNDISQDHKIQLNKIVFFDYPTVKYFESIAKVIKKSSRFEFFNFLKLDYVNIGENILQSSTGSNEKFSGHILPEEHSSFEEGFKIISFYIDAGSLLKHAYVLRKEGWKSADSLYQRMIVSSKIRSMRKYLYDRERVFVNNIITVLPINKIKLYDDKKEEIKIDESGNFSNSKTTKVQPTEIEIDSETNIIGIVDGQHRVYAYHEGDDKYEDHISKLRKIQNLLVTGILYPRTEMEDKRLKFEAELFLEINANQTGASSDLKQTIELMIHPFSSIAIAKFILNKLNESGPLENKFEQHFYEKGKLKTASIISYGLKPLVKFDGNDSLFKIWEDPDKETLKSRDDFKLLNSFKIFCIEEIRKIFIGFKANVDSGSWSPDRSVPNSILSVTVINGIINCFRLLIENDLTGDINYYTENLNGIKSFPFSDYKSSQYRKMGEAIFEKYFSH